MAYNDHEFLVEVVGLYNGSSHLAWSNVYAVDSGATTDPADVAMGFYSSHGDMIMPSLGTSCTTEAVYCKNLGTGDDVLLPSTVTGGSSDPVLPSNMALVFTHHTTTAGKSGRGRTFLPYVAGAAADQANPSLWDGTTLGLGAIMDNFRVDLTTSGPGMTLSVNSRLLSTLYSVTSSTLNSIPGQMGKRRYG